MGSESDLYLKRAQNEFNLATIIMQISKNEKMQFDIFHISSVDTYFSSVISHAYFCIFYSAKAYLIEKT